MENEDIKHYMEKFNVNKMSIIENHFSHFKSIMAFEKELSQKSIHNLLPHLVNVSVYPYEPSALFYYMMQYGVLNLSSLVSSVDKYEFDNNKYITVKQNDVLNWSMHHNFMFFLQSKDLNYLMAQKEMNQWIQNPSWVHGFLQVASQQISSLPNQEKEVFKKHIIENILYPFSKKGLNVEKELENAYLTSTFDFNLAQELEIFKINQEQKYLDKRLSIISQSNKKQKI